jgi:hypothetical protein
MDNLTPVGGRNRSFPARLVDILDRWLSARADNRARARGHTITRVPGTRTQVYRDPRWARLAAESEVDETEDVA